MYEIIKKNYYLCIPGNHIKTSLITSISAVVDISQLSFAKTPNSISLTNLFLQPLFQPCLADIPELSDFPGFVAIAIFIARQKATQIRMSWSYIGGGCSGIDTVLDHLNTNF